MQVSIYIIYTILLISIILNILLIIRGIVLIKQIENLFDIIREYITLQTDTIDSLENMLNTMKSIDSSGAFESDDEVGSIFTQLKETIEYYKREI
jgi:predicted PurR-regulated permease PerM